MRTHLDTLTAGLNVVLIMPTIITEFLFSYLQTNHHPLCDSQFVSMSLEMHEWRSPNKVVLRTKTFKIYPVWKFVIKSSACFRVMPAMFSVNCEMTFTPWWKLGYDPIRFATIQRHHIFQNLQSHSSSFPRIALLAKEWLPPRLFTFHGIH